MLTNHDTDLIRELYKDYKIETVDVRRSINRKGDRRTGKEVIITNYNISGGTYNG
jgi:DNA adenine methylase